MGMVIGIDVGGSTTKIIGVDKEGIKHPMIVKAEDPITSLFGAFGKYIYDNGISLNDIEKVMLTGVGSAYVNQPLYGLPTDHTDEELTKSKNPILILVTLALLSSIVGGVSSVLQLEGAKYIDASLLYPFITGGSIVLSSLAGWIFFKEKATKNMIISVVLAFVGTLFFLQL